MSPAAESSNERPPKAFFWAAAVVLGFLQVWAHRHDVSPDGISYIELAEAARHAGWKSLLNGYWSPFYPFLLSIAFRIFHPAPLWESTVAHLANFAIYLANLFCFEILLRELICAVTRSPAGREPFLPLPSRVLWTGGYLWFLWSSAFWLTPAVVTPDLCVAALVYGLTSALLRICRGKGTWPLFAFFGASLGVAYLAKTAMFPIAFVFLACAFLLQASSGRSYLRAIPRALLALTIFLLLAVPFAAALSRALGKPTIGESGRIAYAEYVDGVTLSTHWQGDPPGSGIPAHPTRKLLADPPLYEFSGPVPGSYPPWYDPSYWYEGVAARFSIKGQLWVLFRSANAYLRIFSKLGTLYFVFLALLILVRRGGEWDPLRGRTWLVWLPAFAALVMYAFVLVETRYVGAFAAVLVLWTFTRVRVSEAVAPSLRSRSMMVMFLAVTLPIIWSAGRDIADVIRPKSFEQWEVAQGLHEIGVPAGNKVGYVGTGLDAYWAHLAQVRVIAEIPARDRARFLSASLAKKHEAWQKFREAGAQAVVTKDSAVAASMPGWQRIGSTPYYLYQPKMQSDVPSERNP